MLDSPDLISGDNLGASTLVTISVFDTLFVKRSLPLSLSDEEELDEEDVVSPDLPMAPFTYKTR